MALITTYPRRKRAHQMGLFGFLNAGWIFLRSEFENVRQYENSWRKRLWLYRRGFLSSKDALWDLREETVDQYLSDYEYRQLGRIEGPYEAGLDNKLLFHFLLSPTDERLLPTVFGLVRDGGFVDVNGFDCIGSVDELEGRVREQPLIVKPVTAAKGDGVTLLDWQGGGFRVNGRPVPREGLQSVLASDRDLLVTERVTQAPYAARIYPDATNTMRLLTMVDPDTGEPFLASAVHRFGTAESGHVDNWSRGGVSAEIDRETGELGRAVGQSSAAGGTTTWMDAHPDTGVEIAGTVLPAWERVTETVLDLATGYAGLWPHVGWDVVITDDRGSIAVLEGESQSVDADQQAHGPLLASDRVRRFYEQYGVLTEKRNTPDR